MDTFSQDPRGPLGCDRRADPTCFHRCCWCCCGICAVYNWDWDYQKKQQIYSPSFWVMLLATIVFWPVYILAVIKPPIEDPADLQRYIMRRQEANPSDTTAIQEGIKDYYRAHGPDQYADLRDVLNKSSSISLVFGWIWMCAVWTPLKAPSKPMVGAPMAIAQYPQSNNNKGLGFNNNNYGTTGTVTQPPVFQGYPQQQTVQGYRQ